MKRAKRPQRRVHGERQHDEGGRARAQRLGEHRRFERAGTGGCAHQATFIGDAHGAAPARTRADDAASGRAAPAPRRARRCRSPCAGRSRIPDRRRTRFCIRRSRTTLATIEAAAIEATMPSPPMIGAFSHSESRGRRGRPPARARAGAAARARPRASAHRLGAQDIVAVDARRRRHGERDFGGRADFLIERLAAGGRKALGIVEARAARGRDRGSRRRPPPARPRAAPASSQPATGAMPRSQPRAKSAQRLASSRATHWPLPAQCAAPGDPQSQAADCATHSRSYRA